MALILVTYDVDTGTSAGRRRLRKIAKRCMDNGQRVQNSVFECSLDAAQLRILQADLLKIMDPGTDSIRFYNLGNNFSSRIEHFGAKPSYMPDDVLIV